MNLRSHAGRRRLRLAVLLALAALLLLAAFARQLCPLTPTPRTTPRRCCPPGPEHPLGTDRYGRDMLSRVLMGGQVSIFSTLALVAAIAVFGTAVGVVCGYAGGAADAVLMRLSDLCLAFPGLVFALAVAAVLGGGVVNAVLALAAISWPKYARLARSQTLALRRSDFIAAARLAGSRPWQVAVRHLLPNILGPILVTAALDIGTMMMELAGLSFWGWVPSPPPPSGAA